MQHPQAKKDDFLKLFSEYQGKTARIPRVRDYYPNICREWYLMKICFISSVDHGEDARIIYGGTKRSCFQ